MERPTNTTDLVIEQMERELEEEKRKERKEVAEYKD